MATAVVVTWSFSTDLMSLLGAAEPPKGWGGIFRHAVSLAALSFGLLVSTIRSTYGSILVIAGASLQISDQMPLLGMVILIINAFLVALTAAQAFARAYVAVALVWMAIHIGLVPESLFIFYGWAPCLLIVYGVGRHLAHLRRQNAEIHKSAEQATEAQRAALEAERRNIARDLHDVVAHDMTVVAMQADAARISGGDQQSQATLAAIADAARQSLQDLRSMMQMLAPPNEELTRPATPVSDQLLRREIESAVARLADFGVDVRTDIDIDGNPDELDRGVQIALAPVVRECSTNIIKHAGTWREAATIDLDLDEEGVGLRIENTLNGSPASPSHQIPSGGFGLYSLTERLHTLGGTLSAGHSGGRWIVEARVSRSRPEGFFRMPPAGRPAAG